MVARDQGHVVNISSAAATYPYPGGNVYGATKGFRDPVQPQLEGRPRRHRKCASPTWNPVWSEAASSAGCAMAATAAESRGSLCWHDAAIAGGHCRGGRLGHRPALARQHQSDGDDADVPGARTAGNQAPGRLSRNRHAFPKRHAATNVRGGFLGVRVKPNRIPVGIAAHIQRHVVRRALPGTNARVVARLDEL